MKRLFLTSFWASLFICLCLSFPSQAQFFPFGKKIAVEFNSIKLNKQDTCFVINYNLKGSKRRYYNTRLFYSNNRGNSFKGPLRSLQGIYGDSIRVGKYLTMRWYFRRDNPYFDGKNINFKLEAEEVLKVSNGGPKYALRSLLVPGLGDTKVRNGYNYGWITALTYSTLGAGVFFHFKARNDYNDYEDRLPNTEEEHRQLFNDAKEAQNISRAFFIAGGTIWLADIIGVYARGVKNRRRVRREQEKNNPEGLSLNQKTWIPYFEGGPGGVRLTWKF